MIRRSFENDVEKAWPSTKWQDVKTVIAVSGGADSVALLRAIRANTTNEKLLTVVHFNHGLRMAESDQDERFVVELCGKLGIDVETTKAATDAVTTGKTGIGLEASARNARYEFLKRTAESIGARYVLTAHTADDQAETVLHNICRGTGLAGVAGIPFARPISEALTVIRPMLDVSRAKVIAYLRELDQAYQTDSSNQSDQYTRNRIRNNVLPQLEEQVNAATREHLCQLAQIARGAIDSLDVAADQLSDVILRASPRELHIACERLSHVSELLVVHFLKNLWKSQGWSMRDFDAPRWLRVAKIAQGSGASEGRLPGGVRYVRESTELRFVMD